MILGEGWVIPYSVVPARFAGRFRIGCHAVVLAMIRYFLVLAVTGGSLLVADFVLGMFASGEVRGPHEVWHGVHLLFSLLTVVVLLGIHSIVYTYFMATGKWAKEVVAGLPASRWFVAQAKRNKRRAFRFIWER